MSRKSLKGFDSDRWINDKNGCEGVRKDMQDDLLKIKFKLRGLNSREITDVLGKPDAEELARKNQKYYIYYITKGPACEDGNDTPLSLYVRFTAVGIANELVLKEAGS